MSHVTFALILFYKNSCIFTGGILFSKKKSVWNALMDMLWFECFMQISKLVHAVAHLEYSKFISIGTKLWLVHVRVHLCELKISFDIWQIWTFVSTLFSQNALLIRILCLLFTMISQTSLWTPWAWLLLGRLVANLLSPTKTWPSSNFLSLSVEHVLM